MTPSNSSLAPAAAAQAAAPPKPLIKVPLYAFRLPKDSSVEGTSYRSVAYSVSQQMTPDWEFVCAVGSVFQIGSAPAGALPIVQFLREINSEAYVTELALAPEQVGTQAYEDWKNAKVDGTTARVTVLGAALPPGEDPPADQVTRPLLCVRYEAKDGSQLADIVTTDLDLYVDLCAGKTNIYGTPGAGTGVGSIAQVIPVFQVEVDHIGKDPIAAVTLGISGPNPGDIEVPYGPGQLIDFYPRSGSGVTVQSVTVAKDGDDALGFSTILVGGGRVLLKDGAPVGDYEYTINIETGDGHLGTMDPRIRNRTSLG